MRFILLAFLSLAAVTSSAQLSERNKLYFSNCLFAKVGLNTVFDHKGGMVPVSLEYNFSEHWGIQVDVGIPIMMELTWRDENKKILEDYRVGGSMKWYFAPQDNRRGFLGVEAFYRQQKAHWGAGSYGAPDESSFTSADAFMQSRVGCVIIGLQRKLSNTLFFECQGGAGVNYRSMQWTNMKDEKYIGYSMGWWTSDDKARGSGIVPFLPIRFTLSLLLGSTKRGRF